MSYFRAIASRAAGRLATGLSPSQMSRSPIAEHDQRLYHGTPSLGESARGLEAGELMAPGHHESFGPVTTEPSAVSAAFVPAPAVSATTFSATGAPLETTAHTVLTRSSVTTSLGISQEAPRDLGPASTSTPALPFVPSRSYDAPTPSLEHVTHVSDVTPVTGLATEAPPLTPAPPSSSRAVLAQALSAVQSWMAAPEAPAVREIASTLAPLPERVNATFLPAPQLSSAPVSTAIGTRNAAPAMLPVEARPAAALPLLESAPRLSIGRVEIEIVRPQITAPAPRPVPTTRAPGRAAAPTAPAAPRSSALDAKRNFGMRQR